MASVFKRKGRRRMARRRASLDIGSIMDRAWRGIHARIREHDLEHPFVPSPWNVPWFHPGASYFSSAFGPARSKILPDWAVNPRQATDHRPT